MFPFRVCRRFLPVQQRLFWPCYHRQQIQSFHPNLWGLDQRDMGPCHGGSYMPQSQTWPHLCPLISHTAWWGCLDCLGSPGKCSISHLYHRTTCNIQLIKLLYQSQIKSICIIQFFFSQKKFCLTNGVWWLNDIVWFSHKWEVESGNKKTSPWSQLTKTAWPINRNTHITNMRERGYLWWMEYVFSGGIYAKDIASPKPIEKALLEWEMKWFKISFGSLGFKEEFNEAGLFSSWGGCTNSLLNIPNIFLTIFFFFLSCSKHTKRSKPKI